jgi:hypothetical protein
MLRLPADPKQQLGAAAFADREKELKRDGRPRLGLAAAGRHGSGAEPIVYNSMHTRPSGLRVPTRLLNRRR